MGDGHGRRRLPFLCRRRREALRRDDPRRGRRRPDVSRTARRGRPDRSLELPPDAGQLEARAGAGLRQHCRPEARGADASHRASLRRAGARGGNSRRRGQRGGRPGFGGGRAADRAPRRRQDRFHRLDRGRAAGDGGRRQDDQAGDARAGRQVGQPDLRGRGPRARRGGGAGRCLRERRAGLLRPLANPGPEIGLRPLPEASRRRDVEVPCR